jgi:hypothetical protein
MMNKVKKKMNLIFTGLVSKNRRMLVLGAVQNKRKREKKKWLKHFRMKTLNLSF